MNGVGEIIFSRDGAQAIELALNSQMKGHHIYMIANNVSDRDANSYS